MNIDAVLVGSVLAVVIAVAIVVFLAFKVKKLMNQDAARHKGQ
jgi:hypothetical protein